MSIILNLILIIVLLPIVYILLLRPKILTWDATKQESELPLPGDELAPFISATRAITIDVPINAVWKWLIQLGADRSGFFSYAFIEKILGYEFRAAESTPQFHDMKVGSNIPASLGESKRVIKLNFPVVAVEPGQYFILGGWGPFILKELNPTQTRLIVRTHGQVSHNFRSKVDDFLGDGHRRDGVYGGRYFGDGSLRVLCDNLAVDTFDPCAVPAIQQPFMTDRCIKPPMDLSVKKHTRTL